MGIITNKHNDYCCADNMPNIILSYCAGCPKKHIEAAFKNVTDCSLYRVSQKTHRSSIPKCHRLLIAK